MSTSVTRRLDRPVEAAPAPAVAAYGLTPAQRIAVSHVYQLILARPASSAQADTSSVPLLPSAAPTTTGGAA